MLECAANLRWKMCLPLVAALLLVGCDLDADGGAAANATATGGSGLTSPNGAMGIVGSPATHAVADNPYSFTPTTTNANGTTLGFSIENKPQWATFNTASGTLSGTPGHADVGTYSNIVISASDGSGTSALASFSITVVQAGTGTATLAWSPPDQNTDGSALTNLSGYRIYYGTDADALTHSVDVPTTGMTSYVVGNLGIGTWYFAIKAYNTVGVESDLSNIASKSIS